MKCKICGKEEDPTCFGIKDKLEKECHCFECHFWANRLEEDKKLPPHTVCMIDGGHYIIEDENDKSPFRGFGGDKFVIKFNDGTEVTTTNLWYQGKPQGYWKEKFPNNANFDWKWKNIGGTNYLVKK